MGDVDQDLVEGTIDLFLLYLTQYDAWTNPVKGAVSPALSEFFAWCDPEQPALVHWARWLRIDHESDDGIDIMDLPTAKILVETMITYLSEVQDIPVEAMRVALHDPSYGRRDPNQQDLF
jgi:hypothetical protein